MAFSIKQLLFCIAVVAFGLTALFSGNPIMGQLFDVLTLGILIGTAYSAWISCGELRAFRVGFLCWAVLYFLLFKKRFDVGIDDLMHRAYSFVQPMNMAGPPYVALYPNFNVVCHCLILLLLGVVGGYVTVYFYHKRQRLLQQNG